MILRLWMRKNSPQKHTSSFPFHLGSPGQPWPGTRDAAMNHVLSRSDALECSRGERPHRRRIAKVISPSPLLSLEGKSHLDLLMSPESHLSLNRGDRLPAGRDWLPGHCMKMLAGSSQGEKDPVALPQQSTTTSLLQSTWDNQSQ